MRPSTAVILSFLLSSTAALPAAEVSGSVRTVDGRPLPQVVLKLSGPAGARTIVTGAEGRYRASDLAPAEYTLGLDAPGFVIAGDARVTVGETPVVRDVVLAAAPVRERVVVAATRSEAAASSLGVTSDVLEGAQIEAQEPSDLLHVLQQVPGVTVARTGGVGVQGSVFLRGGVSNFARVLVDGVPANEPGGAFDFGALALLEVERIEVVRGAASSLYGTDALAGVLQLVTRRALPGQAANLRLEGEGGSFDWQRYRAGASGQAGRFDWNAGASRLTTDNEQPNCAFRQTAGAATSSRWARTWSARAARWGPSAARTRSPPSAPTSAVTCRTASWPGPAAS
jgi:outer membrane receptor protein involved in Fe transport